MRSAGGRAPESAASVEGTRAVENDSMASFRSAARIQMSSGCAPPFLPKDWSCGPLRPWGNERLPALDGSVLSAQNPAVLRLDGDRAGSWGGNGLETVCPAVARERRSLWIDPAAALAGRDFPELQEESPRFDKHRKTFHFLGTCVPPVRIRYAGRETAQRRRSCRLCTSRDLWEAARCRSLVTAAREPSPRPGDLLGNARQLPDLRDQ